jgi:GNAT superfamily N-acetyltransferase
MSRIQIYRAANDHDFEDAQALCRECVTWQLETYPEQKEIIAGKFLSGDYERTVANLAEIHAAPGGAVILCKLDGETCGCVMHDRMDPQVAEVHRLFVSEGGRGHGIGGALLEEMFSLMRAAGYSKARFSSARFLEHARDLYEKMGFHEVPAPKDAPPHIYFMEREL